MSNKPIVAYFSAEYAISDDLPIYAGGLGILAADTFFQAGDDGYDFYSIGLTYHKAFTGNDDDHRSIVDRMIDNGFELICDDNGDTVYREIDISSRAVKLQAWQKQFGTATMLLLDAKVEGNHPEDIAISDLLYAADAKLEFAQEVAMGFGGLAFLDYLGVKPDIYHLNEGHTAITAVAIAAELAGDSHDLGSAMDKVRPFIRGTKHTILSAAGLFLDKESVKNTLAHVWEKHSWTVDQLMEIAGKSNGDYSDTRLLIASADKASGVSEIHVAAEAKAHKSSPLQAITNGVYAPRWRSKDWSSDPSKLDDKTLWKEHCSNRSILLKFVEAQTGAKLRDNVLTVVWARRMTSYKRPELLVSELERLKKLVANNDQPIQFIVAGQANPADQRGVELMQRIIDAASSKELSHSFAYLPRYNPATAKLLVQGADVWLNTPIRGMEACGTSGMKASLNGAVQFSTSDGWIDEIDIPKIGWELAEENSSKSLYDVIEEEILPLYYETSGDIPVKWVAMMRANIELIEQQFTSKRMLNDYYKNLYT